MKSLYEKWIRPNSRQIMLGIFLFLTVLRIFLFVRTPLAGAGKPGDDDWNLVSRAWGMLQGEWFPVGDTAMSFGMAFPLFLLICNIFSVPYMLAAGLLYIGSALYFLHTWKEVFCCKKIRGVLYLLLLYSPVMMTVYTAQRIWDFTLVPALILLLLSLGYRIFQKRNQRLVPWLLFFGVVFTFFWYLRRTNYWILPLFVGFLIFTGYRMKKEGTGRKVILLLIPVLMVIAAGLGISLLNLRYYKIFGIYEKENEEAKVASAPSDIVKDTLLTVFHLSSNQMIDVDTYTASGSEENLRILEAMTGSTVIYPDENPLKIEGWAFPTNDSANLELAVTNHDGVPLAYAEFENSEDVYLDNMEYAASRVCRFTLEAPVRDMSQVTVTIYIDGEQAESYPIEQLAYEEEDYHIFIEKAAVQEDPALTSLRSPVTISKIFLFLNKIIGFVLMILAVVSYIGLVISLGSEKGRRKQKSTRNRVLFLTGMGVTALIAVILNCIRYPSLAGLDPGAYSSGPWMLIQIFVLCSTIWFLQKILSKKQK